jgi:hypothetical protein
MWGKEGYETVEGFPLFVGGEARAEGERRSLAWEEADRTVPGELGR